MKKLGRTDIVREVPKDFQEQQAIHWDLRYGGLAKDKRMWMIVGIISLCLCCILAVGYIMQVREGKYIPYMITMGELGTAVSYKPAARVSEINHRVLEGTLARFIYCLRTVSIDKRTLKLNIDELYSYLNTNDPAYNKITQYLGVPKNDPYKRAVKIVTSINITNVMKMPSGEWVIKWKEDVFTRKGKHIPVASGAYQAIINVMVVPASINNEEEMNLLNPVGIYVRDISWQKELN